MDNKVLGKGLSALIPQRKTEQYVSVYSEEKNNVHSESNKKDELMSSLDINLIRNNRFQPRKNYDESKLGELKASIKEKGVLQPILVRPVGNEYEVVAGERRLRASRELNLKKVPVIIKNITDREALVLALVENIQREELNPIEEAQGFKRLIEEFNFTQETVADSVGKDRTTVTNFLRLLKLPKEIQDFVASDKLSVGHARTLLSLDEKMQKKTAADIIAKGLSVRQVEAMVKKILEGHLAGAPKKISSKVRDIQILEEELSRTLGTKVCVENKNNKGRVVIEYYSLDDLDRILGVIRK